MQEKRSGGQRDAAGNCSALLGQSIGVLSLEWNKQTSESIECVLLQPLSEQRIKKYKSLTPNAKVQSPKFNNPKKVTSVIATEFYILESLLLHLESFNLQYKCCGDAMSDRIYMQFHSNSKDTNTRKSKSKICEPDDLKGHPGNF